MKKILKLVTLGLVAVLTVVALTACKTSESTDYTVSKKAFSELNMTANKITVAEAVSGTEKTIPGSYKYKELENNVTFEYDIPKETVQDVDRYTRLFKVTGPSASSAYMLITDEYTSDTAKWTMWDVLGNITYPNFQYTEINGGNTNASTMKDFLAGKQTTYQGYWGNASAGNSYESNKQANGNLKATLDFHFGANTTGKYTVTLDIVNLTGGTVLHSVVKTITVE